MAYSDLMARHAATVARVQGVSITISRTTGGALNLETRVTAGATTTTQTVLGTVSEMKSIRVTRGTQPVEFLAATVQVAAAELEWTPEMGHEVTIADAEGNEQVFSVRGVSKALAGAVVRLSLASDGRAVAGETA